MDILLMIWKFRNEIGIALIALIIAAIIFDIKHTYSKADQQAQEIRQLQEGLRNAQNAVKLQADIQLSDGYIDKKTFRNISTILHKPVPVVLVSGGVFGK